MLKPKPEEETSEMLKDPLPAGRLIFNAISYKRQGFVPSVLRGEPKMLGVLQIFIGLIIASFGVFLSSCFNLLNLPKSKVPILYKTGYPYWAALCYTITGFAKIASTLFALNEKKKRINLHMNVLCVLVSTIGVALQLYSLQEDGFFQCMPPLSEGICTIGNVLFHGVVCLFLILTVVQLSIAATFIAFECKGARKSLANEVCSTSL